MAKSETLVRKILILLTIVISTASASAKLTLTFKKVGGAAGSRSSSGPGGGSSLGILSGEKKLGLPFQSSIIATAGTGAIVKEEEESQQQQQPTNDYFYLPYLLPIVQEQSANPTWNTQQQQQQQQQQSLAKQDAQKGDTKPLINETLNEAEGMEGNKVFEEEPSLGLPSPTATPTPPSSETPLLLYPIYRIENLFFLQDGEQLLLAPSPTSALSSYSTLSPFGTPTLIENEQKVNSYESSSSYFLTHHHYQHPYLSLPTSSLSQPLPSAESGEYSLKNRLVRFFQPRRIFGEVGIKLGLRKSSSKARPHL